MRDAFGGAFMLKLFLVFIALYIGFTAIALNYAKAFKVKNKMIEYLESSEITDLTKITGSQKESLKDFIDKEIVAELKYNASELNICNSITADPLDPAKQCFEPGILIEEVGRANNTEGVYYRVSTYIGWKFPFLNNLINNSVTDSPFGIWKISGETRLIVNE